MFDDEPYSYDTDRVGTGLAEWVSDKRFVRIINKNVLILV